MKRKSLFGLLLSLVAVSAMLFALAPAGKADAGSDLLACTFEGSTIGLDDIPGPLPDPTTGLLAGGGYQFEGPASCTQVDVDGASAGDPNDDTGTYEADIHAEGTYLNLVCGTGTTEGVATLTLRPATPNSEADTIVTNYDIQFVGGQGPLQIEGTVQQHDANGNLVNERDTVAAGAVSIDGVAAPGSVHACVDGPAVDFDVTGAFAGGVTE